MKNYTVVLFHDEQNQPYMLVNVPGRDEEEAATSAKNTIADMRRAFGEIRQSFIDCLSVRSICVAI